MINSFIYPNDNFYQQKTSSCNSFDISSNIFHFSYQVCAWRKSQYLFYDQRKCTFIFRSSDWRSSVKKKVLKNFTKFTGKHLCQSLFFDKFAGLRQLQACILSQIFGICCRCYSLTYFNNKDYLTKKRLSLIETIKLIIQSLVYKIDS